MITLLDSLGPMIWRTTWQATVLAMLVALILWCCGERLKPRWRFLMWGVVLMRLLLVVTPGSSWSLFNLARLSSNADTEVVVRNEPSNENTHRSARTAETNPKIKEVAKPIKANDVSLQNRAKMAAEVPVAPSVIRDESTLAQSASVWTDTAFLSRVITSIWLIGVFLFGLKLLASAIVLRRRLSACHIVVDRAILESLESICRRTNIGKIPTLLVTPENISPYIVGTWHPRIVLPESVVTESTPARLRHVFAHELSHLSRWDLWSNWLLLAARILHWFNPICWVVVREMQAEREAACDEMAFTMLNENDRTSYADSIIELAANLKSPAIASGLIGFFSAKSRLQQRIERFLRAPSSKSFWTPISVGLLLVVALSSLTDAQSPSRSTIAAAPPESTEKSPADSKDIATVETTIVTGSTLEGTDRTPLAGITVRLYKLEGRTSLPVEIAKTISDKDGKYEFKGLAAERPEDGVNRLKYGVLGFADDFPIGIGFSNRNGDQEITDLWMTRKTATLFGKVINSKGEPIAGATIAPYKVYDQPVVGLNSAVTDAEGRFKIENIGQFAWSEKHPVPLWFHVLHPDYPPTTHTVKNVTQEATVAMADGCVINGSVIDRVTGKAVAGVEITARRVDKWGEKFAASDAQGKFKFVTLEGRYNFVVKAKDRVCVAIAGRECLAGEKIELPSFELIEGGFISGQVVNTATGNPMSLNDKGKPITVGLVGPSDPMGYSVSPIRMAYIGTDGRFTLRAAPGENYPYFVNFRGERMSWNIKEKPAVLVKAGETTNYNMLHTPPITAEVKMKAARKVIDALSKQPPERTTQILLEFRKLNHTVDETELWCSLMQELVAIGPDAVPQLCVELDEVKEDRAIRRLAIALRAIGDPRAIPALIRAIPKTLLPSSSDYGLLVDDKELTEFMQKHGLDKERGKYFNVGRPIRELFGTLHALTKQKFDDDELYSISLSEDPRRQVLQRRIYNRHARKWQVWWNANWQTFTKDNTLAKLEMKFLDEELPPAVEKILAKSRIDGGTTGAVLSPASEKGKYVTYFYDLDTGYEPRWPEQFSRDESKLDQKQLDEWATRNGVDLMCVTHKSADGKATYQLRAIGMQVVEIDARSARNIDQLVAAGTSPDGRPVSELLMHYDVKAEKLEPNAHGTFLFTTREGNRGVITTIDRITRTANLSGMAVMADYDDGVGFHRGVKFNLREIVPPKAE